MPAGQGRNGRRTAARARLELSRRTFLGALLSSCAVPQALAQAPGDLRFAHAFGEFVLPKPATRVVSLGYTSHDALLALQTQPIAVRYWFGDQPHAVWPWAAPYLNGAAPQVLTGEVSAEVVAALQPDLIVGIGSGISEAEYALLSQIAPVLMHDAGSPAYGTPWNEMTLTLGRALGKDGLAGELVAGVEKRFADARARHPDWAGRSAVPAYHFGGETGVFTAVDTRGRFLRELGFVVPDELQRLAGENFYAGLSPEDLSVLDADLLMWISSFEEAPDLVNLPMRKMLRAHSAGREVFAGGVVAAAMSFGSVLSLPFVLDRTEADIAAALDGDPATEVASAVKAGLAP